MIGSLEGARSRLVSSVGWVVIRLIYCEVSVLVGRYVGWWMNLLNCLFIAKLEDLLFGRLVARSAAG